MSLVKEISIQPISASDANAFVRKHHYSGKVVPNSQLHLGAFLDEKCGGVMSFGPSIDKRKVITLVANTKWSGFLELNRMAFADWLPKNSESRSLSIAMRIIRKNYPHVEWVISFADGAQCGDGCIYRASGFKLIGIKRNTQILELPWGQRVTRFSMTAHESEIKSGILKRLGIAQTGKASVKDLLKAGAFAVPGYMLRYIYFLDKDAESRLTVPVLPFSEIDRRGARIYKGIRESSVVSDAASNQLAEGGATPTGSL